MTDPSELGLPYSKHATEVPFNAAAIVILSLLFY